MLLSEGRIARDGGSKPGMYPGHECRWVRTPVSGYTQVRTHSGPPAKDGPELVYWIARGHNGRIDLESQVGRGTPFSLLPPLISERAGGKTDGGSEVEA